MKLLIASVLFGAIAINASSANAAPKMIKDSQGRIFITGLVPSSSNNIQYPDVNFAKELKANSCGIVFVPGKLVDTVAKGWRLSKRDGSSPFTYRQSSPVYTVRAVPDCFNGVSNPNYATQGNTFYQNPDGNFMITKRIPNALYLLFYPTDLVKKVKANACGVLRLTDSVKYPLGGQLGVNGTNAFVVASSTSEEPPLCRDGITLIPRSTMANGSMLIRKNLKGDIIFGGLPNSTPEIKLFAVPISKTLVSDRCGLVRYKPSASKPVSTPPVIKVASSGVQVGEWQNATTTLVPKCSIVEGQPTITNGFSPTVVKIGDYFWFKGLVPEASYKVEWNSEITKVGKVNACGVGRLRNSTTTPIAGTISVNGQAINTGALTPSDEKVVCRGSVYYAPAS